jgi:hypothetical protein
MGFYGSLGRSVCAFLLSADRQKVGFIVPSATPTLGELPGLTAGPDHSGVISSKLMKKLVAETGVSGLVEKEMAYHGTNSFEFERIAQVFEADGGSKVKVFGLIAEDFAQVKLPRHYAVVVHDANDVPEQVSPAIRQMLKKLSEKWKGKAELASKGLVYLGAGAFKKTMAAPVMAEAPVAQGETAPAKIIDHTEAKPEPVGFVESDNQGQSEKTAAPAAFDSGSGSMLAKALAKVGPGASAFDSIDGKFKPHV